MLRELLEEYGEELEELARTVKRIIYLFVALFLVLLVPVSFSPQKPICMHLLLFTLRYSPIGVPENVTLIMGSPIAPVKVLLSASLFFTLLIGMPFAVYMFYYYVKPDLDKAKRKCIAKICLVCLGLFYTGIIYGLLIIAPLTLKIMAYMGYTIGVVPVINIADYYEFIVISIVATAIGFLIPIPIYYARKMLGLDLNLRKNWRYIFVASYAVLAVLTPDPTPITTMLILAPPLTLAITAEKLSEKRA